MSMLGVNDLGIVFTGDERDLLRATKQAGAAVDDFAHRATLSSKQISAATRGIPAQFTDIVVSLQAGQNPLTVFLQQGGQLKDMFGGIGPAARAMGGYVTSLISPLSLVGAGFAAVGVAAYQGAAEIEAFNRHVILTGGMAGLTGDRMMDMAASIDAMNFGITQSAAAEKILEIAAAGVRGEDQLRRYALATAEFERAGGAAAGEVGAAFKALGKDPLGATLKLTEQMGYLTEATYLQIKSLVDQGQMVDAVRVAQDAYAAVIEQRTPGLVENVGYLETAWRGVSSAVREAWDTMLKVGRDDTLSDQVRAADKRLSDARMSMAVGTGQGFDLQDPRNGADERRMSSLRRQMESQVVAADLTAKQIQHDKDRISYRQKEERFQAAEKRVENEILSVRQMRLRGTITEREETALIASIRAKSEKAPARGRKGRDGDPFASEREAAKGWADAFGDFSKLALDAESQTLGLTRAQQRLVEFLGSPAYTNASEPMRELALQQAYVAIAAEQAAAATKEDAATRAKLIVEAAKLYEQELQAYQKSAESAQQSLASLQQQNEAQALSNTMQISMAEAVELTTIARLREQQVAALGSEEAVLAIEKEIEARKSIANLIRQNEQADNLKEFWKELDSTASSVFMDLAMNGEDAFKRLGESLKREVIQLLYEMTVKKWIFQIAGISGGGGGGGGVDWISMATKAYDYYTGGGSGAAGGAGVAGGGAAIASQYGTTVGSQQTAMLAAQETGMAGSASTSMMGYFGYAAMIAAAVMVAENLYAKGYTRMALGEGGSETAKFGQYSSYNTDPSTQRAGAMQNSPAMLMTNDMRKFNEALGMSSKWADILSGTTRMATLIGRKLGAYGYEASIAGGDAEVGGFARYKGGVFRSNKTVKADVDPRDAANFDALVESTIEGARGMARAMGYSDEAINKHTTTIRVNFKNTKTAEEQAQRMAEAMDNLQFELLKTASGGKIAREEFKQFMEGVQKDIEAAGISTQGLTDILAQGIVNGSSGAEIGAALSQNILGGIYATMAQNAFAPVAAGLVSQIITPMFTAMAAGVPVSQVISKQAITSIVAQAQAASAALKQVFANAEFQAAMADIETAIKGVSGAAGSVKVPSFKAPAIKAPKAVNTTAQDTLRERIQLENELLGLQGNTAELRRRELLELKPTNRALQQQIWLLEDQQEAAEKLKDTWGDVIDSMLGEMKRLREEILGTTEEGKAFAMAEFTMATAKARAGDSAAAELLPDLARAVVDMAGETAASLGDLRAIQGFTLSSLAQTRQILGSTYGIALPAFAVGTNYVPRDMVAQIHEGEAIVPKAYNPAAGGAGQADLVAEVRLLRGEYAAVKAANVAMAAAINRMAAQFDNVSNGGNALRMVEA